MSSAPSDRRRGLAWALSSAVGGAMMAIPWKLANEIGDPAHSVLVLLGAAAIANTALTIGQRRRREVRYPPLGPRDFGVAALLAVFTLLGNWTSAVAIQDLTPALLNVLLRADIIFVALFGWILLGERANRRFWLGAGVAAIGLVVLQGPMPSLGFAEMVQSATGLALAAALCFGSLSLVTRFFIHSIDPLAVNSIRLWLAVAFWFLFNDAPDWGVLPREQILYATLAAITGPFLGRLALMMSARYLEARVTTLATLTTPVLTLFLAFALLGDWPASHELLGGAIMITGISIPFLQLAGRASSPAKD